MSKVLVEKFKLKNLVHLRACKHFLNFENIQSIPKIVLLELDIPSQFQVRHQAINRTLAELLPIQHFWEKT